MSQTWNTLSADPNSPVVQDARRAMLVKSRAAKTVDDREAYLADLVKGLDVLDVGVVAHTPDAYQSPQWLHRRIAQAAKSCLGVDILEKEVTLLKSLGFNVICQDICKTPLHRTFDMVVCGELIEHLGRPGDLFESCHKMLRPGGRLVMTTPNPGFITYALKNMLDGQPLVDSVDHVAWYDPATLAEMGARHGLELSRYTGVRATQITGGASRIVFWMAPVLRAVEFRKEAFAKTIIYEFTKRA